MFIVMRTDPGSAALRAICFYAGVTRGGERLVVLVGQKKAVAIAVRNATSRRRWSKLDEWLRLAASRGSSNSELRQQSDF
jgi:hypothetical protein